MNSLISIITPVYNAEKFVGQTIESVLAQTHANFELLLIVDTKSSDTSLMICESYSKKDTRIRVLSGPATGGVSANRNLGIDQSKGEWIAFLDADDQWLPDKLKIQSALMQQHQWPMSYHSYSWIDEKNEPLPVTRRALKTISAPDLLPLNWLGCLTVMVRRSVIGSHRFQNIENEDWIFWHQLLSDSYQAFPIDNILARYRILPNSRSAKKVSVASARWKTYREYFRMPVHQALKYFCFYAVYSILIRRAR